MVRSYVRADGQPLCNACTLLRIQAASNVYLVDLHQRPEVITRWPASHTSFAAAPLTPRVIPDAKPGDPRLLPCDGCKISRWIPRRPCRRG